MSPYGFGWGVYRLARRGGGGSDPQAAIDELIAAAGPSLFQYNDASTYDAGTGDWPDSSGNGRDMTPQSGAVAPSKGTLNGRPAVQFGASNRLTSVAAAADYLPLINRTGRAVIYMVLDMAEGAGQDMYLFNMGSSGSGMWNGYVDVSSSERAFTLLRDNTGSVATNIGLGGIGVPTGVRNQFLKASADTEADMVSVSSEGNTSRNPAALSGTAPASLASTLVIGGLNAGSLSFPMDGPVSAFIILESPTEEQERAVEVILRREYLKQDSVLVDVVEAAGSSLYQFNDASAYNSGTGDWFDASVNGRDMFTVDENPTASTLFGRPALNFDGDSAIQRLQATAPASDYQPFVDQSARGVMYVIAKGDGVKASGDLLNTALGSGWSGYRVLLTTTDSIGCQSYNGTTAFAAPSADGIASGGFYKIQQGNGASQSLTYEGPGGNDTTATSADGTPFAAATQTLSIGGYPNTNQSLQFAGDVAAVILLLNPTEEQENAVEAVIRREYLGQDTIQSLGPAVFLKADTGVTFNGSAVSGWADQSGWGNDMEQTNLATQPAFASSGIGGQPSIDFVADDRIEVTSLTQGNINQPVEIITVANWSPTTSGILTDGDATQRIAMRLLTRTAGVYAQANATFGDEVRIANEAAIWSLRADGVDSESTIADTTFGTVVYPSSGTIGVFSFDSLVLGGDRVGGSDWDEQVAEVIAFPRKLSFTERDQVMKYLSGKYGIPYTTPLPYPAPVSNFLGADFDGTAIPNTEDSDVLNLYGDQQGAVVTRKGHQALHLTGDTRMGGDSPGSSDGRYNWPGVGSNTISLAFVLEWQSNSPGSPRPCIWGTDQAAEVLRMGRDTDPSQASFRFGSTYLDLDLSVTQDDLVVFVVSVAAGSFVVEFRNITTGASSRHTGVTNSASMATCWFNDMAPSTLGFAPENYWFRWSIWDKTLSDADAATVADAYAAEFA